jgi:hypothetical protein
MDRASIKKRTSTIVFDAAQDPSELSRVALHALRPDLST